MVASSRVYIGNLGPYGKKEELEEEFGKCGSIKDVWIARNPPGFAFIVYNDPRDAEAAVSLMDGKRVCGVRVKVELSHQDDERGRQRGRPMPRRGPPRGSPPRGGPRGSPRGPPPRSRGLDRPDRGYGYSEERDRRPPVDRERYSDRPLSGRYESGYDNYRSYGRDRAPPPSSMDRYGDRYNDRYDDRYGASTNGIDRYRDGYSDRSGDRYGDRFGDRGGFGGRRSDLDGPPGGSRLAPRSPPRRGRSPPPRSWGQGRSRSPLR